LRYVTNTDRLRYLRRIYEYIAFALIEPEIAAGQVLSREYLTHIQNEKNISLNRNGAAKLKSIKGLAGNTTMPKTLFRAS